MPRSPTSIEVLDDSPALPTEALEGNLPLEVHGVLPTCAIKVRDEAPTEGSGPSWLQLGFEMPIEEVALKELASEITRKTPPLNNICFTNRYAISFIGGAILNRAADVVSLASMGGDESR